VSSRVCDVDRIDEGAAACACVRDRTCRPDIIVPAPKELAPLTELHALPLYWLRKGVFVSEETPEAKKVVYAVFADVNAVTGPGRAALLIGVKAEVVVSYEAMVVWFPPMVKLPATIRRVEEAQVTVETELVEDKLPPGDDHCWVEVS